MEEGEWFTCSSNRIEGQRGGTSILRYVHSGIFMDDWDTQYDAVQQHTDFYLHTLGQYLEFFDGQPATYIGDVPGGVQGPACSAEKDGFDRLKKVSRARRRGGGRHRGGPDSGRLSPISGSWMTRQYNFLGSAPDALYRFFGRNAFGQPVGMSIHMFGRLDHPDVVKQQWQEWLETSLG